MIEVKQLSKHYGSFVAVDDISFDVAAGDVLGFLGPNGAGKSTTMKMLTGFLAPTSGTAVINGHDVLTEALAVRQQIGYLPEGAPSYGELTVLQFLRFVARARGLSGTAVDKSVDEAVHKLNLTGVTGQTIETLSKGFKRRVGLAQAILHDPRVLILDEPTDGLDPNQKHEVRELIAAMGQDKIIVISTHILEEVQALCNRVMIIAEGRLLADATPAELVAQSSYHNAVTLSLPEPEKAASVLSQLQQASRVQVSDDELTVFPAEASGLLEAVMATVEAENWQVSALRLEAGRLDEVFRNITRQPSAQQQGTTPAATEVA